MTELLSCPFCGSANLESGGDDKFVGVRCVDCEASGPNHYGKTEWNTRKPAPRCEVQSGDADLAHPERLKALSDAAAYVEMVGARYHSGRDIANGIRCLGPQSPTAAQAQIDPGVLSRLRRWRDVGDGPISYCAGGSDFAADVTKLVGAFDTTAVPSATLGSAAK